VPVFVNNPKHRARAGQFASERTAASKTAVGPSEADQRPNSAARIRDELRRDTNHRASQREPKSSGENYDSPPLRMN